jgi:hypothetical protein
MAPDEEAGCSHAWDAEAKAFIKIRNINHPNILQCLAAIRRGRRRYFMFPWADGGNLREFWSDYRGPRRTPEFVKEVVDQVYGLADALDKMHNYVHMRPNINQLHGVNAIVLVLTLPDMLSAVQTLQTIIFAMAT